MFLSHQVGGFTGVYLGGYFYEQSETYAIVSAFCGQYLGFESFGDASRYDMVWLLSIALGITAALVHWPIKEITVGRFARSV